MASFHLKDTYFYYHPCIDDPKKHYGFKPGLLVQSISLGVDISNWEMFDDDWVLESKEVSPLGEELSLFDRPNKVERGRILEARRLESIIQQQISQRMALSHHNGVYRYYHPHLNSSVGEPSPLSVDFVILDIKEDEKRPFILGTPFLTTAKAVIKFDKGTITLRSGKSKISFHRILESLCKIERGVKNDIG
ncbi:ribonuclease H-like domain-containing protein [Tanacetum coccineum]